MSRFASVLKRGALVLLCGGAGVAQAFETSLGGVPIKIDNLVSVGAMMRMQDRDSSLIGKTNVTPGLCMVRTSGDPEAGPSTNLDENQYAQGQIPAVCATSNPAAISQFNASPGAFSPNGDGGNMNFDQYDIVHATTKLTTDVNIDIFDFHIFARGLAYYDINYANQKDRHFDATLSPAITEFSKAGREEIGVDFQMLDYFVTRNFNVWDREVSFRLGNQVLNWGESAFLIPNSLNSISPPNQALLRIPGFDVKELLQPVGMAYISAQLMEGVNLESFYQYQYKSVVVDPVGSFFSTSDTIGPGGHYAMLSFGRAAEDPGFRTDDPRYPAGYRGFYRAIDTCDPTFFNPPAGRTTPCVDSAGVLGSTSSRTIYRDRNEEEKRKPSEGGQYGFALKYFADWLNGGTELAAYYANYHSRFPTVSAFAADNTCITDAASIVSPAGCGLVNLPQVLQGNFTGVGSPATREPLPVDTVRLVVEYPENVRVFGLSFNTTIGDFAFSGEYTYRPNLPMQVHSTDVIYAALQPAFPEEDVTLVPNALVIPGRRSAVPDFLMTNYRQQAVTPGMYIQGYERMKQSQAEITFIRIFGGDNWVNASQITALLEIGDTYVHGFPDITELQFQGAGTDTHISAGADGSLGINPRDVRTTPDDFRTNTSAAGSRQNPTAHADVRGFGTQNSWGYRAVVLTRYDDSLFGANYEFLTGFFHDVGGVGPGIGQNFVAGRKVILAGLRFDYLSRWNGEIRYSAYTGGGKRDQIRDRDNLLLTIGYQF